MIGMIGTRHVLHRTGNGDLVAEHGRIYLATPCCSTRAALDDTGRPVCPGCGTAVDVVHTYSTAQRHPVAVSVVTAILTRSGAGEHTARQQATDLLRSAEGDR